MFFAGFGSNGNIWTFCHRKSFKTHGRNKIMERKYEGCFLIRADIPEEEISKEVAFIEEKISGSGAKIVRKELWGKKHLAYPIKKKSEAIYYLFYFNASPETMLIAEPQMRRRENILRYLFLQRKRFPEGQKEENTNARTESE